MKLYNLILKVIFNGSTTFLKYRKVNNINTLFSYLENNGYKIDYVNLYDHKTKQHIESYSYPK